MSDIIINRVAESLLTTLDLETYYPSQPIVVFDLKPFLFMELILKEKDFREALKNHDWTLYAEQQVTVTCSADAIIPMWANMLVAAYLAPVASAVYYGTETEVRAQLLLQNISGIDPKLFENQRVVVKGCGDLPIGEAAYLRATALLQPFVKSIMYGEPCSTVPIYKKK